MADDGSSEESESNSDEKLWRRVTTFCGGVTTDDGRSEDEPDSDSDEESGEEEESLEVSSGYSSASEELGYSLVLPEFSELEVLAARSLVLKLRRWASWASIDAVSCDESEELDTEGVEEESGLEGSDGAKGLLWDAEELAVD